MNPRIKSLETGRKITKIGRIMMIDPASSGPHSMYCSAVNVARPSAAVFFALELIMTRANMYSPQAVMKAYAPTVITPGMVMGSTMRMNRVRAFAPSTWADSSSSFGMLSKNETRSHVQKGEARPVYTTTSAEVAVPEADPREQLVHGGQHDNGGKDVDEQQQLRHDASPQFPGPRNRVGAHRG